MAKDVAAGGIVSPANLWGKPLPKTIHKTTENKEKDTRMLPEEEIDSDVDAELEDIEGPDDEELSEEETSEKVISASADDEESEDDDEEENVDDEDEDSDEVDAEVDSTVEADEEKSAPKRKKVVTNMAEKKSMSDHVRDEIERRKKSGDSLRGVDIVTALGKKGIKVSPAQVSQLLKKANISAKARGTHKTKEKNAAEVKRVATSTRKGETPRREAGKSSGSGTEMVVVSSHLKAAKAFLAACDDSYDAAREALDMHQQLHDVL